MNLTQLIDIKEKIAVGGTLTPSQRDFVLTCINETTGITGIASENVLKKRGTVHISPPNYLGRIDQIWAFLSVDDGGEGICSAPLKDGMLTVPMIAADKRRLDSLRPIARQMPNIFKKPVRLAKFATREDIEIYQPDVSIVNTGPT